MSEDRPPDGTLNVVLILDACNLRGVQGWPSRAQFNESVQHWASRLTGALIIIAHDRGADQQRAERSAVQHTVLVMSGPRWSADDVIVRDVGWWHENSTATVTVVTSDKLLRSRCRHAARSFSSEDTNRLRLQDSEAFCSSAFLWRFSAASSWAVKDSLTYSNAVLCLASAWS